MSNLGQPLFEGSKTSYQELPGNGQSPTGTSSSQQQQTLTPAGLVISTGTGTTGQTTHDTSQMSESYQTGRERQSYDVKSGNYGGGQTNQPQQRTAGGDVTQGMHRAIDNIAQAVEPDDNPSKYNFLSAFFVVLAHCFSFGVLTVGAYATEAKDLASSTAFAVMYFLTTGSAVFLFVYQLMFSKRRDQQIPFISGVVVLMVLAIVFIIICIGTVNDFARNLPGLIIFDIFALAICVMAVLFLSMYHVLLSQRGRDPIRFNRRKGLLELAEFFFSVLMLNFAIMLTQVYVATNISIYLNTIVAFSILFLGSTIVQVVFSLLNIMENSDADWRIHLLWISLLSFIFIMITFPMLAHVWATISGIALGAWLASLIQLPLAFLINGYRVSNKPNENRHSSSSREAGYGGPTATSSRDYSRTASRNKFETSNNPASNIGGGGGSQTFSPTRNVGAGGSGATSGSGTYRSSYATTGIDVGGTETRTGADPTSGIHAGYFGLPPPGTTTTTEVTRV